MKPILLLLATAGALRADLLATFHTTRGDVIVSLQYAAAPRTVANFMTLAQGTRPWLDSASGVIRKQPFYDGTRIHRTANSGSFKFAQGGSPKGDGSDGPGYTIKDEFHPSLTHVPYVLSMANAGPNTNGSQFFFTGSLPQSSYNNVHTIFGLVTDTASRSVVDAMITAGDNATVITTIDISRTDPAALAFDEMAQGLPAVFQPAGNLAVAPGVSAVWNFQSPLAAGDVFQVFRSTTLAPGSWAELPSSRHHLGIASPAATAAETSITLDDASQPRAFYNLTVARHPGAVAPSTLTSRTVTVPLSGGTLTYQFDSTGAAGLTTYTPTTGSPLTGTFTVVNPNDGSPSMPFSGAHHIHFTADTPALSPRYLWVKAGCDSATGTLVNCHHQTQYYAGSFYGWQFFASGPATITR